MSVLIDELDGSKIIRCDIGSFVVCIQKLKSELQPIERLYQYITSIYRWEKPALSCILMIACCYIVRSSPVYILLAMLSPFPPLLVIGLLKTIGRRSRPEKRYVDLFQEKDDRFKALLQQASQAKAREHMNDYLDILIALHRLCAEINEAIDGIHNVFSWSNPKVSFFFLIASVSSLVIVYTCDPRDILLYLILALFLVNYGLFTTLMDMTMQVWKLVDRILAFTAFSRKKSVDAVSEIPDSAKEVTFHEAVVETESSSDSEDDLVDSKSPEVGVPDTSNVSVQGVSVITKLRRRLLHSGICANGNHRFTYSNILSKRQRHCRHCGNIFCSRCCNTRVPRALLGATAPAAYTEQVYVCTPCHTFLTKRWGKSQTELVE